VNDFEIEPILKRIAHCVTIGNNNDVVVVRYGRSDRRIDTAVGCPACDEDATGRNALQDFLQCRSNKRIVQRLLDHDIISMTTKFRQERPSFGVPLKATFRFPAVSDPDDRPGLLAHDRGQ
jgi:arginyl-tRNA--protein-N-Asp/Glu arginylyltransferase